MVAASMPYWACSPQACTVAKILDTQKKEVMQSYAACNGSKDFQR